jgi:hypothetical protein
MTLVDLPWGFWNGLTAWIILIAHAFGGWTEFPLFDVSRDGNWYAFGFLLGAGSPFLGAAGAGARRRPAQVADQLDTPIQTPVSAHDTHVR